MRSFYRKGVVLVFLVPWLIGCGGGASDSGTGTRGDVSGDLLGSGNGTASLFVKGSALKSPSISKKISSEKRTVSYQGGTVTTFDVTIKNLVLKNDNGSTVSIAVNSAINLADPDYDGAINFLASQSVATGNYSGVNVELGTVTFVASGISPDPTTTIEGNSNKTISVDTSFSIKEDGELAIPLVLDLETILSSGFGMAMDTPFAIRVSVLPLSGGNSIWTTGDMIGFADDSGHLYAITDTGMGTPVGTYTATSSAGGTYVFTAGTYIGIKGNYEITQGGTFSGDANGFFSLNGDFSGGYWVESNGLYGTFALTNGWIPDGTGTFEAYDSSVQGTITLNSEATGGSWTGTDSNGTFTLE
ncbi:MAG: hypothetical protein HYS22_00385 [Deltaproteobacteria bacterium]|nr:hypothetical protein [Deltaproteobacteria bacterium]